MKPVSYTPRNSFTEIIVFRMTQKHSNLLHMTGQVRVPFQHRSQHPASFVGNFTDQAPFGIKAQSAANCQQATR